VEVADVLEEAAVQAGDRVTWNRSTQETMISEQRETPNRPPREGWDEAFTAASPAEDDLLLLASIPENKFDLEEW
jgi:hypothetical protein